MLEDQAWMVTEGKCSLMCLVCAAVMLRASSATQRFLLGFRGRFQICDSFMCGLKQKTKKHSVLCQLLFSLKLQFLLISVLYVK